MTLHTRLQDCDWSAPEQYIRRLGTESYGKEVGVFALADNKYRHIYLTEVEAEHNAFKSIKLQNNEYLVRYISINSAVGYLAPLVKINIESGKVYFLKNYDEDEDNFVFDAGTKVSFLRTSLGGAM